MAKNNVNPIIKLPPESKKSLEALSGDLEAAEAAIASLDKLGMDTVDMKQKLEWAKKVRETLLSDFT